MNGLRDGARVYIAGPMTGYKSFNIPAFDAAALDLRGQRYDVVSPAELDDPETRAISLASPDGALATLETHNKTWGMFLSRDVALIADGGIEAIFVLKGWEHSRGARLETFVGAAMCGLPIFCYDDGQRIGAYGLVKAWAGGMWTDVLARLPKIVGGPGFSSPPPPPVNAIAGQPTATPRGIS